MQDADLSQRMTREELWRALEGAEYRFAHTMPSCPHWYTLRETWDNEALFEAVVQAIRDYGQVRPWPEHKPKYHNTYFDAGEWTYWTMGTPLSKTILINRAKIKLSALNDVPDEQP